MEAAPFLLVLSAAVTLYVTAWVRIEITSIGVIVALALLGILKPEEALSGFSHPATVTVVSMLVLSSGLERAGVVDYVARKLSRGVKGGLTSLLLVLALPAAGFSAFMNNTPVVAMMIPVALILARRAAIKPSKVLLPLSYLSILGGTCTLFGTSTNILVHTLWRQEGGPGFGVFEFSAMGLVYLVVGSTYVFLTAGRLLPDRLALGELLSASAPGHFVTEVVLPERSRFCGRTIEGAFPDESGVSVLEVIRGEEPMLRPTRELLLEAGDVLFLESTARSIHSLLEGKHLEFATAIADDERVSIKRVDLRIAEAVITPASRFIDRRVRDLGLSRKHGVQVLAVRRLGRHHRAQLRGLRLRAGDVLLVQGEPASLHVLQEERNVLLVEGVEQNLTFPRRAPIALGILAAVVLLAATGVASIVMLALAGVGAMLLTSCLDVRAAARAIDPTVLLLLAGTIPLGLALEETGLASDLSRWLRDTVQTRNPYLLVGGLYVLTSVLTAFLSNSATAVLLTPLVLELAVRLNLDARPLLMAVCFGGSASFATPIGYQTNALVMGPGGYVFRDYLRFGLPLNVLLAIAASFLIPHFWPLTPIGVTP